MTKQKVNRSKKIMNRRARFDYTIGDGLVVGIELTGPETKALRLGHGQLTGAYVMVKNGELWLVNALISGSIGLPISESDQTRTRKLLAKKKEIANLITAKQQNTTIIPLELLTSGRYIKLRIATAKGKKRYDKRELIKSRDESRRINRALKSDGY
jgi:SsrA-binding protein